MLNRVPEVNADQRRALELLSDAGLNGCTGATLLSHGFSIEMLADLIRDGLATTHREPLMSAGQRQIDVPACVLRTRGGGRWDNATLRTRAENAIAGYLANPRRSFSPIMQSAACLGSALTSGSRLAPSLRFQERASGVSPWAIDRYP